MRSDRERELVAYYDKRTDYTTPINAPEFFRDLMEFARVKHLDRVLDIGCGTCSLAIQMWRQYGARTDGIDISQERLQHARKALSQFISPPLKLITGDVYDLVQHFEEDYDLVVMVEILEHLEEPLEVLAQATVLGPVVGSVPIDMNIPEHLQYYPTVETAVTHLEPDRHLFWDKVWSVGKGFLMLYWEKQG